MKHILTLVILALLSAGVGLATGWFAAEQTHVHPDASDAASEDELELDVQTLAQLGVRVATPELVRPSKSFEIAAHIEYSPDSGRVITAPFDGDVLATNKRLGDRVSPGEAVVTMLRRARPSFEAQLAEPLLQTVSDELHRSYAELRVAYTKVDTLRQELARLDAIDAATSASKTESLSLVDRERLIQLRYEHRRAASAFEAVSHKLEAHGVLASDVLAIARGGHPPHGKALWKNALRHHGLWPELAEEILGRLPQDLRARAQSLAGLGELAARDMLDAKFASALADSPAMRANFLEVVRLRLAGTSVDRLGWLNRCGALSETMRLVVPPLVGDPEERNWSVEALLVQTGQHVTQGSTVARVRDASEVQLVLAPIGAEVAAVRRALSQQLEFSAKPLLKGSAEALAGLKLRAVLSDPESAHGQLRALASCRNTEVESKETSSRSWRLLPGMRFIARIEIPHDGPELVRLPRDAIVRRGARSVVYGTGHGHPHDYEVRIVSRDSDFVYVEASSIPKDEKIAVRGALALALAIEREAGGGGGHHGHSH